MKFTIYALIVGITLNITSSATTVQASGLSDPVVTPEVVAEETVQESKPGQGFLAWFVSTVIILAGSI